VAKIHDFSQFVVHQIFAQPKLLRKLAQNHLG